MAPVVVTALVVTDRNASHLAEGFAYLALILGALVAGEALRARRALLQLAADEQERERAALLRHHFD